MLITPVKPITILVVDDHRLVGIAMSQVLISQSQNRQIALAYNYLEAEEQTIKLYPDVIWLNPHIAHSDSIVEIGRLRKLSPASHIMILTDREDEQEGLAMLMAGAQGYYAKQDVDPDKIAGMIETLCRGEFVLRPVLLTRLIQRLRNAAAPLWDSENETSIHTLLQETEFDGLAQLTSREREILQLISQGYRDRHIADGLHISEKTVQKHVQSILSKLGAQNRTQAAYIVHSNQANERNDTTKRY